MGPWEDKIKRVILIWFPGKIRLRGFHIWAPGEIRLGFFLLVLKTVSLFEYRDRKLSNLSKQSLRPIPWHCLSLAQV